MLPNIREHSLVVAEVAVWLGRELQDAGIVLNLDLIEAGALLHDLGKTACLGSLRNHAEWGAVALEELGLRELADIVREHIYLSVAADSRAVREAEVVHYADKRVLHDRVVSVAERFADLKVRYGRTAEAITRLTMLETQTLGLEHKLFAPLPAQPQDLLRINHWWREP